MLRIFGPKKGEVTGGYENCIMSSSIICTQILLVDQIKEDELGETCCIHGSLEKYMQCFSQKCGKKETT